MNPSPDVNRRIAFVMRICRAVHAYGSPAHRLEETAILISRQLDLKGQFFSTPTSVFAAFGPAGQQNMVLERTEPGEINLGKLAQLDDLLVEFSRGDLSMDDAERRVDAIVAQPARYSIVADPIAYGLVALSGTYFFGGSWSDLAAGAVVGLAVGLVATLLTRVSATRRLVELLAAATASVVAISLSHQWPGVTPFVVSVAALLVLLPGLNFTVAAMELASKHFVSGGSRFAGTLVVLVTLGFGSALGRTVGEATFGPIPSVDVPASGLPAYLIAPALLLTTAGLAQLFRARRKDLVWVLVGGAVAYLTTKLSVQSLGPETGAFLGSVALGLTANWVARLVHRPSTVLQVPGLILLVPGSIGYRSVSALVEQDTVVGIQTAFTMSLVAVAIVAGLLLANAVLPSRRPI